MGIFDLFHRHKKQVCEIVVIEETVVIIENEHFHKRKPLLTLSTIINHQTYIMPDISLALGVTKSGVFTLTDNKTGAVITDAVFSNQAVGTVSNPEIATFALDPSNANNLIGTPVAAGSGTVTITTDATYTDLGDGTSKSGSFSVTKNYSVVPSEDGVSFDVVFP